MSNDMWIWECENWPNFVWNDERIAQLLRQVRLNQGKLLGKMGVLSHEQKQFSLDTLLSNIIHSSAIEGEKLNVASVRSSLARRLGVMPQPNHKTTTQTENLATIMLDAVNSWQQDMSLSWLLDWHRALFPEGYTLFNPIQGGVLRGDEPMQVVSGRIDRPKVHFEAPDRAHLDVELERFIDWFNLSVNDDGLDPIIRAAITHLWFVTIHPFEDGNGRITRLLTDLALAQAESQAIRFYAMSASIAANRKDYYLMLEAAQRGDLDITDWVKWFLVTLDDAINDSLNTIGLTVAKTQFWLRVDQTQLKPQQVKVLNRLLDGDFAEGISASKYKQVAQVSRATASRDLALLVENKCLSKTDAGGRSTKYVIWRG